MLWNKAWSKSSFKLEFALTMELCGLVKAAGLENCGLVLLVGLFGFVGCGLVVGRCGVVKPHIGVGGYELVWIHRL